MFAFALKPRHNIMLLAPPPPQPAGDRICRRYRPRPRRVVVKRSPPVYRAPRCVVWFFGSFRLPTTSERNVHVTRRQRRQRPVETTDNRSHGNIRHVSPQSRLLRDQLGQLVYSCHSLRLNPHMRIYPKMANLAPIKRVMDALAPTLRQGAAANVSEASCNRTLESCNNALESVCLWERTERVGTGLSNSYWPEDSHPFLSPSRKDREPGVSHPNERPRADVAGDDIPSGAPTPNTGSDGTGERQSGEGQDSPPLPHGATLQFLSATTPPAFRSRLERPRHLPEASSADHFPCPREIRRSAATKVLSASVYLPQPTIC